MYTHHEEKHRILINILQHSREGGHIRLFITLVPKVFNSVVLFVGIPTLETFIDFDWLVYALKCPNVLKTKSKIHKGYYCASSLGMYIILLAIVLSL